VLLAHVPAPDASVNVADVPGQTVRAPEMADGIGFTVSTAVAVQPVAVSVNVIVVVPAATPPATPEAAPIVAVAGVLLTHVPAPDASLSVTVAPGHMESVPATAAGNGFTVSTFVVVQPVDVSVNVIVVVPAVTPPIVPVAAPIVAVAGVLLTHVPAPDASVKVVVVPGQTERAPLMAAGNALTVSTLVVVQPVDVSVNVIVVVPAATPPIVPVPAPMVAAAVVLLTHVPPPDASLSVAVAPAQTERAPLMAAGNGLTVTAWVAYVVPQPFAMPYEINAVPALTPVTVPLVPTVAIPVAPLLHTPPGVASLSDVVAPAHTTGVPVIPAGAAGVVLTVTVAVDVDTHPQALVTVSEDE
jgi:hypothetical protein